MSLAGGAVIAIWNDIAAESREDFFEWHPREHMPERLAIPGFLRGRRCRAIDAAVEFFTMYELSDISILQSDAYMQRLHNPTPWSSRMLPAFRNNVRGSCRVAFTRGHAMGGFLLTVRCEAPREHEAEVIAAIARDVMPALVEQPRITGAHLCLTDAALAGGNVGVQRGRMISLPHIVILLEGSTADGVARVGETALTDDGLAKAGTSGSIERGLYQLEYSRASLSAGRP